MNLSRNRKRLLKLALALAVIVSAAALATAVAIWLFLPRERVKARITEELSDRLNQDVSIENVSVGFYPDIEFVAKGVRVVDRQASEEIVSAEDLRLDMNLLKLLKRQYALESVTVGSPRVALVRDVTGTWNMQRFIAGARLGGLVPEKREAAEPDADRSARKLRVGPIRIRNGAISIHDEASDLLLQAEGLRATVDVESAVIDISSVSLTFSPIQAKISGTVSQIFHPSPILDINADIAVDNEGPFAGFRPAGLLVDAKVADITVKASGTTDKIAITSTFSLNSLITAGTATKGSLRAALKAKEGRFEDATLKVSFGKSTLSLSGNCSSIWTDKREALFEGSARVLIEEMLAVIGRGSVSDFKSWGTADADITLSASMDRVGLQANLDLTDAGLTIPRLIQKQVGTSASLLLDGHWKVPDEIVVDDFELLIGEAKVGGTGWLKPGAEPWTMASVVTSDFPLESLDNLPSIAFERGTLALAGKVWQSSPAERKISHAGNAEIRDATLVSKALDKSFENLNAKVKWDSHGGTVESASFSFANSMCHARAEISDFSRPQIVGSLKTDTINVQQMAAAVGGQGQKADGEETRDREQTPSSQKNALHAFSMKMLVEADSVYAGDITTGPVLTTWQASAESHSFDPLRVQVFGGEVNALLAIDTSEEDVRWRAEFEGRDMQLENMMAQFQPGTTRATGLLNLKGDLEGIAAGTTEDMLGSINGDLGFNAKDGEIRQSPLLRSIYLFMQFPVGQMLVPGIREVLILNTVIGAVQTGGRSLDPTCMMFTRLGGSFRLTNGIAHTDDLRLESGVADLLFEGDLDLPKDYMNMKIRAMPLGSIGSLMDKVPVAGKQLKRAKESVLSTDFIARGPIGNPEVTVEAMEKLPSLSGKE